MSKTGVRFILISTLLVLINFGTVYALPDIITFPDVKFWEPEFHGARTAALGSSDIATPSGTMAFTHNPAAPKEGIPIQVCYEASKWIPNEYMNNFAIAGEWKRFRMGMARNEISSISKIIWLAADPAEGPVEGADPPEDQWENFIQSTWTVGISAELLPGKWQDSGFTTTVGANWRHYRESWATSTIASNDADLGIIVGYRHQIKNGWVSLAGAATVQNVIDASYDWHGWESALPGYGQFGGTLTGAWVRPESEKELLRMLIAYSHRNERWDEDRLLFNADRWGFEITALEILSLRCGDNDDPLPGAKSVRMGFGLLIPRRYIGPVDVRLDWTNFDTGKYIGKQNVIGATVGYYF